MNRTTSSRRKRWFFARSLARAYRDMLEKRRKKRKTVPQRQIFAEALEPRVLFSGTPVPVDPEQAEQAEGQQEAAQQAEMLEAVAESAAEATSEDLGIDGIENIRIESGEAISEEDVERLAKEALARWEESGLTDEQLEALEKINYVVTDLEGVSVGRAEGDTIYLDDDAAGLDWFIDQTESLDEEFAMTDGLLEALTEEAMEGIDLLTVIMHEQGHILGLADVYAASEIDGIMHGGFDEGQRRLIAKDEAAESIVGSVARANASIIVDQTGDDAAAELAGTTLREAVAQAIAGDTIVLSNATYTLSQGQITVDKDLIFAGDTKATTIVDAAGASRVFNITSNANVTFQDLTITNGFVAEGNGAGINHNGGTLTLTNVAIDGNVVQDTVDNSTNALGGGLFNNGKTVVTTNTDFTNNQAIRNGGNETFGWVGVFLARVVVPV